MGGYGSGRSGGRPTYESCGSLVLTTTTLARAGLRAGMMGAATLTFANRGEPFPVSITIDTTDAHFPFIHLSHARRSHAPGCETYRVPLQTTPQPFGGVRWWFQCPRTGRRCTTLFLPRGGHQFLSRYAWGLGYASQREDAMGRAQRQARKVSAALGNADHWMDGPPPKPKWMRWSTYERKAARLAAYNAANDAAFVVSAARLLRRPPRRKASA